MVVDCSVVDDKIELDESAVEEFGVVVDEMLIEPELKAALVDALVERLTDAIVLLDNAKMDAVDVPDADELPA